MDAPLADAKIQQLILEQMNRTGAFTNFIGVEITRVGELTAEGTLCALTVHANPMGSVHGGALFTLMDAVGGAAAASSGRGCATIDCTVHFLAAAAPGERLCCRAECVKAGKHIMIVKTNVTGKDGRELATGMLTCQRTKEITEYSEQHT